MKIIDYVTPFLEKYEATPEYYETYFQKHRETFEFYFRFHCKNKEEKLCNALQQHPHKLEDMNFVKERILMNISEITANYEKMFDITFTEAVRIFVGLGGSNAYTTHSMNPEVAFCVERMPALETGIRALIAHEFGHAVHHIVTLRNGVKIGQIDWNNPYTWLIQEGIATYLSTQVVDASKDIYFAFERDEVWLNYARMNKANIIASFQQDLEQLSSQEIFKEWFSINGGGLFGYARLAYYIGYEVVQELVEQIGIGDTILFWLQPNFKEQMNGLLNEFANNNE
ncbi:hypothetical protein LZ480_12755 [Solibacillus sp. MA9]|uniref:DUF2268 domain-containing protein n=1 Tax=Solibacillus palustris TaxID=2908203 RepID=A0ABS9UEL1_9BACL|nr:hypothetical protein [Solibacillus sp. MA9]MCH7322761.1 hypothetical protein [Solibacillus sp. MA9]